MKFLVMAWFLPENVIKVQCYDLSLNLENTHPLPLLPMIPNTQSGTHLWHHVWALFASLSNPSLSSTWKWSQQVFVGWLPNNRDTFKVLEKLGHTHHHAFLSPNFTLICSSFISVAVIKYLTKSNLEEKGIILGRIPGHSPSLKKCQGRKLRQLATLLSLSGAEWIEHMCAFLLVLR